MSDQYPYAVENSIIIQDGNMIWCDTPHDQSLQFMDANDTIIADATIDESYATAIDTNETQYLSILDSSDDVTLENMNLNNLTLESESQEAIAFEEHSGINEIASEETDPNQVVVFTVDGSDDLYGIQLSQDQDGNIQKYQFKFRTTSEGNLEAIPESVQLIASEEEPVSVEKEITHVEVAQDHLEVESDLQEYFLVQPNIKSGDKTFSKRSHAYNEVFIKGEPHSPLHFHEIEDNENLRTELPEDFIQDDSSNTIVQAVIKSENNGCVRTENVYIESSTVNIKQERSNESCYVDKPDYVEENIFHEPQHLIFESQEEEIDIEDLPNQFHDIENNEQHDIVNEGLEPILENEESIVQQLIDDNRSVEVEFHSEPEELQENGEQYHYKGVYDVETIEHPEQDIRKLITKEYQLTEHEEMETTEQVHQDIHTTEIPTIENTNILKHSVVNADNNSKMTKPYVNVKCYIVFPEKENVNSFGKENPPSHLPKLKSNPGSVLKSSFPKTKEVQKSDAKIEEKEFSECDLFHKRFAKSKEAVQAKLFHNFINRTTIPQAPVRQCRQPRKQKIRPVSEGRDEEIIVQEVMISSNGFIENLSQKLNHKKFQVTAIVELSDSEDEPKLNSRHLSRTTSESEISVVEICSDDDGSAVKKTAKGVLRKNTDAIHKLPSINNDATALKRRRGRPPKNQKTEGETDQNKLVDTKKAIEIEKTEIACPRCSKTFPSQNSLNTHLIHHNLESSLKKKAKMNSRLSALPRKSLLPKIEYHHKCDECQETFKNAILLQRHNCVSKNNSLNCSVCLKQFRDIFTLNIHKKTHIKSNMVKNTSTTKVSPKKSLHRPSFSLMKSPKIKPLKTGFKCKECPKVCDSEAILKSHSKTHKKILCSSCSAIFSSRILLDTHVRIDCVKYSSPVNKRLSFKIRKSFIQTPPKRLSMSKKTDTSLNSTLNQTISTVKVECEMCKMKFSTYRNLYTHKVQKHGVSTPDKSLMNKPKPGLYKPRAAHGGIPANNRVQKAFAALRMKLAECEGTVVEGTATASVTTVQ